MMWSVLIGNRQLAHLLWEKTAHPLRSALHAAQACGMLLADDGSLSSFKQGGLTSLDRERLEKDQREYEALCWGLLDHVKDSEEATAPLTHVWQPAKGTSNLYAVTKKNLNSAPSVKGNLIRVSRISYYGRNLYLTRRFNTRLRGLSSIDTARILSTKFGMGTLMALAGTLVVTQGLVKRGPLAKREHECSRYHSISSRLASSSSLQGVSRMPCCQTFCVWCCIRFTRGLRGHPGAGSRQLGCHN